MSLYTILAEHLAESGHEVVGVDCITDYYSPALKRVNAADVRSKGVRLVELDLAVDELIETVADVDFVYHLAAQPGISATVPLQIYVRNNIVATHRLLEAVKSVASLKCFINISTSSVYGAHATDSEGTPPRPTSYYGVTKLAAEQLALAYHRQGKLPACSLHLFSVYGPRERPGDQLKTRANIDKARRLLGYEPKTDLKAGLKAEVDWYKEKVWEKGCIEGGATLLALVRNDYRGKPVGNFAFSLE